MTRIGDRWWMEYLDWLLRRVGFNRKGYYLLMKQLHCTEFLWIIDRDKKRAGDGINLRDEFFEGMFDRSVGDMMSEPCSVLEMLVALAIRIDDEYIGSPGDPHPEEVFWEMICNLALHGCTDKYINYDAVYQVLDTWMHRDFYPDGRGSIFPLKMTCRDQRELEIWSQMQEYLSER